MGAKGSEPQFDILIIGGGINGAGIARDAAGRNLAVCLVEMGDLAGGTSSRSTKLIHGGLRYLEHFKFRLVREALIEREVLWNIAPHIVAPIRFVLPHHRALRPAWLLRLGLFIYDHLGGRKLLPATRTLDLRADAVGAPLKPGMFLRGFEYSDCSVDDARLVVLNARDAADRGASICLRTKVVSAERHADRWDVKVEDVRSGARKTLTARALINAAGPWVAESKRLALGGSGPSPVRLVQGSHIVVPKLFDHDRAYIFQNVDGRIVFAIPYATDFTLIGTTDKDYFDDPAAVEANADEIAYLCEAVNAYFRKSIAPRDVVWHFSGVRSLYDDGAGEAKAATRDYVLEVDREGGAPLLSVFGGKITTYRRLAEEALARLYPEVSSAAIWTASAALPGGDFKPAERPAKVQGLLNDYPFLDPDYADVLISRYGTEARRILGVATNSEDLGMHFGPILTAREVLYLVEQEWAQSSDDVLWRRTKAGLRTSKDDVLRLEAFLEAAFDPKKASIPLTLKTH